MSSLWSVLGAWLALAGVAQAADGPRLLLIGGAAPVCASGSPAACRAGAPAPARLAQLRLDEAAIARLAGGWWHPQRQAAQARVASALRGWLAEAGAIQPSPEAVAAALGPAWEALAGFERTRVLEALEVAPATETVALNDSRDDSGAALYRSFVAMPQEVSRRDRPRVLVSTASGRDPYAAVDFYLALFAQTGAEVRWLPLDHALRAAQARPGRDCAQLDRLRGARWGAQDRAHLHPQRAQQLEAACRDPRQLQTAIDWADAVFLNGGDQSFTRAAWFAADGRPSAELRQLRARLEAGSLVLGGTSAGAAVQAGPDAMLVSGPALPANRAQALTALPPDPGCAAAGACGGVDPDALLVHPEGGLASFDGVVDTHFSERGREYRLARVLLDTPATLAVGVDENTALRLDRAGAGWRAQVLGQGAATWLWQAAPTRLLWRSQQAGERLRWPLAGTAPACTRGPSKSAMLDAGGPALRNALVAADARVPLRLRLRAGTREVAAGQVCGAAEGMRVWEFPPGPDAMPIPTTSRSGSG